MSKSILKVKSYEFALKIIKLCRRLQNDEKEFVLSRQILRSGTAIGALIREAEFGQSRTDFAHKMNIALKEANETYYWLQLLGDSNLLETIEKELLSECNELVSMLVATVKTVRGIKS